MTEGWLDGLIARSIHDWPNVGLVGAVSNSAAPPQQVEPDYDARTLVGLESFAEVGVATSPAGRCGSSGSRVLPPDPARGPRSRRPPRRATSGWDSSTTTTCASAPRSRLPPHPGPRRVRPPSWRPDLRRDGDRPPQATRGRASAGSARSGAPSDRPAIVSERSPADRRGGGPAAGVSLCMIVKDEEANLADCLASAADLVDEVIVVDTGSTDRTPRWRPVSGRSVFEFPWVDDFAAARNESLRHATRDWIFWLDADDRVDEDDRVRLRSLFAGLGREENVAYSMKCLCPSDSADGSATVVDHIRLFRNDPRIRWRYRVHEQILPAVRRTNGTVRWSDVTDPARRLHRPDPSALEAGARPPAAAGRGRRSPGRSVRAVQPRLGLPRAGADGRGAAAPVAEPRAVAPERLDRARSSTRLIVHSHRRLGQAGEALAACRSGRAVYPDDAELLFQEGLILRGLGRREDAAGLPAAAAPDRGRRTTSPALTPACAATRPGITWRSSIRNKAAPPRPKRNGGPPWPSARDSPRRGTGSARSTWPRPAGPTLRRSRTASTAPRAATPNPPCSAPRRPGEEGLHRRSPAAGGRHRASPAVPQAPSRPQPCPAAEGREPRAAERALRDVLALDPLNAEARHNLSVLLSRSAPPRTLQRRGR